MPKYPPSASKSPETLRVIESLLLWEGAAGNERIRELFDLHPTTASRLLAQYAGMNSHGLVYSSAQRRWLADADFRPCLTDGSLEQYLAHTAPFQRSTDVVRTHVDFGAVSPQVFAVLHRAMREGLGVTARHSSMRHPTPTAKTFFPHAVVEAGRRWHVRAFVPLAGAFQDLAVTRLSQVRLTDTPRPEEAAQAQDQAWTTWVEMRVVPHPNLTPDQKQLIRAEYFGRAAARIERVRAALLPYVIHELRAATDPERQQPPDFQLCIEPSDALASWLMPTA